MVSGGNGHGDARAAAVGDIAVVVEGGSTYGNGTAIGQVVKAAPFNGPGDLPAPSPSPPPARNIGIL